MRKNNIIAPSRSAKNITFYPSMRIFISMVFIFTALPVSLTLMYRNTIDFKTHSHYLFGKSLDEKYTMIDGDFYKFMLFCKDNIPPGSKVLFYNSWRSCKEANPERAFFKFQYEREKSQFYLFPIITYIFLYDENMFKNTGEIYYRSEEDILKKVSFVIVYSSDRDFPGFKIKCTYDSDRYILSRDD